MRSLWDETKAVLIKDDPLSLRVYSARLIGQDRSLVLHGGGNMSVKTTYRDIFGHELDALYVKGSGWDVAVIEKEGFAPVSLERLIRLAKLPELSDTDMMKELRLALYDPFAPNPSVEAILHAIIPHRYVDHTHADAVVTISNTPRGRSILEEIYGGSVLILPFIMPGFILARAVYQKIKDLNLNQYNGMILEHHGVFTWGDDARSSYQNMVVVVQKAEDYLNQNVKRRLDTYRTPKAKDPDPLQLSVIRKEISTAVGSPQIVRADLSAASRAFAQWDEAHQPASGMEPAGCRGPLTPDHIIRIKAKPVVIDDAQTSGSSILKYRQAYRRYYERYHKPYHICLSSAPKYAIWKDRAMLSFGSNLREAQIISEIVGHTIRAVWAGEMLGGWQPLAEKDLFEMEYWELEQAKLKRGQSLPPLSGRIALVTGSASGIGRACVEQLHRDGACVTAVDINPANADIYTTMNEILPIVGDVSDDQTVQSAVQSTILAFGGLDIVIVNAGIFPDSATIDKIDTQSWHRTIEINLTSAWRLMQYCIPYLKNGWEPTIIVIGSKNVPAPGPGAAAYSVSKAGVTQLARVAALELGTFGIRVNIIHPNAVFDTGIWTDEVLRRRAESYHMDIKQYKTNNLLRKEITSNDVARLVITMIGPAFRCITGAQIPIDGGNDRVV